MKIEIGESLIYSWLRHAKGCQLVQTNWKPSTNSWELKNEEKLQQLMQDSTDLISTKYDFQIFKGTTSLSQLLQQAEIDVLGVNFEENGQYIYGVDIAFHEAGLNYGSKDETVMRVAKKFIRTAMCLYGYFDIVTGEVIFASPKIHNSVFNVMVEVIPDVQALLRNVGLNYEVRLISNEDFEEKVLQPVIAATSLIADTSELFMRSMQMFNLFSSKKKRTTVPVSTVNKRTQIYEAIEVTNISGLNEMKIGALVRSTLTKMLREHQITPEEIELMQTAEYSKEIFDVQYPLLRKASFSDGKKVLRYWADPVEAYGEKYFICSEWYETPQNNDRPYFMKWLGLHQDRK